jgi:hypothetical protein
LRVIGADGPERSEHFKMVVKEGWYLRLCTCIWVGFIYAIVTKVCGPLWACNWHNQCKDSMDVSLLWKYSFVTCRCWRMHFWWSTEQSLSVRNQIPKYLAVCMVNIVHKILVQSSTSPMINSLLNNMLCWF